MSVPPQKICPACHRSSYATTNICPGCGYYFKTEFAQSFYNYQSTTTKKHRKPFFWVIIGSVITLLTISFWHSVIQQPATSAETEVSTSYGDRHNPEIQDALVARGGTGDPGPHTYQLEQEMLTYKNHTSSEVENQFGQPCRISSIHNDVGSDDTLWYYATDDGTIVLLINQDTGVFTSLEADGYEVYR